MSDLILEILKDIQHRIGNMEVDIHGMKESIATTKQDVATTKHDIANLYMLQIKTDDRMAKIEKRLDISE